mmetsp:Transcript_78247/g.175351  ORF Transcript_78247/g.175351 Transcript_78247/m.175351 type:complete len:516 (-) Transcript_78247:18-1565(-)
MATAEEIRAEIAAEKERQLQVRREREALQTRKQEAEEKQRLRRELDELKKDNGRVMVLNDFTRWEIGRVDKDEDGPNLPNEHKSFTLRKDDCENRGGACIKDELHVSCSDHVRTGEYVWKIGGMSWLRHALLHTGEPFGQSDCFDMGNDNIFDFVYHPERDRIRTGEPSNEVRCASLAMRCFEDGSSTFRYRIYIQRNDGEFVQWGPQGEEYSTEDKTCRLFGPDVQYGPGPATGIFGLTHEALLQSEWVHNDTLTVKFELEVRHNEYDSDELPKKNHHEIEVPPSSLASNFLSLLEDGKCSDVTFVVKGETLKAHSLVLIARCEFFEKQFQSGMSESVSKEVMIDDCEPDAFKAFLQYLYSDDFSYVDACMKKCEAAADDVMVGIDTANNSAPILSRSKASFLQDVFSLSNKYQVIRLSMWCQQQLCDLISDANVCAVLIQAHLCEARVLEETCLTYIKCNMQKVATMPSFADLSSKWPEIMMKLSLYAFGFSSSAAASSVAAHQSLLRKRKRE